MAKQTIRQVKTKWIPVKWIEVGDWNPNEQDAETFNQLCESLREIGWVEDVLVIPKVDENGDVVKDRYVLAHGHHKFEAARLLGMEKVGCKDLGAEIDLDVAKALSVRMNVLRGKMNPEKFVRLYQSLTSKYGKEQVINRMMRFADQDQLQKLLKSVKVGLPAPLRNKIKAAEDEIKDIEGLSDFLHRVFREQGETLKYSYLIFEWGGKTHTMVKMDAKLRKQIEALAARCSKDGEDMAKELSNALS